MPLQNQKCEMRRISVVTIVFRDLEGLKSTYSSLLNQSSFDFEWVVINGNPNDETDAWLSALNNVPFPVNFLSEFDSGIADAWNKGISRSKESFILILNAGDVYFPEAVETFSKHADFDCIVCSHASIANENGNVIGEFKASPAKLRHGMHIPHNWCCVPLSLYAKYGTYNNIPHSMDFDWFHRYYKKRGIDGFKIIEKSLGCYKLGGHSDKNFKDGFLANAEILRNNGMSYFISRIVCAKYILKHSLRRLWRTQN